MLKRLRWFVLGVVTGVAGTVWALAYGRSKVQELTPAHVAGELASKARTRLDDVRAAIFEGRLAMRERESELRSELDRERGGPPARPALTVKSSTD
ncbi:MAG TPA: hypothetical protein PKA98_09605 [Acidimicrobiales bacterium]|nr:hypothetical protein [Acidimicrobiales bacterium]